MRKISVQESVDSIFGAIDKYGKFVFPCHKCGKYFQDKDLHLTEEDDPLKRICTACKRQ